jgi:hypothetical protein
MENELNVTREQFEMIKRILKEYNQKPIKTWRKGTADPDETNDYKEFLNKKGNAKWVGTPNESPGAAGRFKDYTDKFGPFKIYTGDNGKRVATDGTGTYYDENDRGLTKKQAETLLRMYID